MSPNLTIASLQSAFQFFHQGGFFMLLLLLCSMVSVTVIVLRALALRRDLVMPPVIEREVEAIQPGDEDAANRLARLVRYDFSILENNTMASCASAAGYMSSAGLVSAIPALDMMIRDDRATGHPDPALQALSLSSSSLVLWLLAISVLGVVMAVPVKRQLINAEQLKFPSGIAAAETLRSMYSKGNDAIKRARALLWTGAAGAVLKFLAEARRAARRLLVIDAALRDEVVPEEMQERVLNNGSRHAVYKRYFTPEQLVSELGGGNVLYTGRWFVAVLA